MTFLRDPKVWNRALPYLAFLITFLVFYPFSLIGIDQHHDGYMFKTAIDVASGQKIFRDTFSQYGLLTPWMQAFFLIVFGASLKTLKITTVFMYAVSSGILTACFRSFLPIGLNLLALGIWILFPPFYEANWIMLPWSSVYAIFFQSLTLSFLLSTFQKKSPQIYPLLAGVTCALALLCRQSVGLMTLAALLCTFGFMVFFKDKRAFGIRAGVACLCGFGGVFFLFLAYLKWNGIFSLWKFQSLTWPKVWVERIGANRMSSVITCLFIGRDSGLKALGVLLGLTLPLLSLRFLDRWKPLKFVLVGYYALMILVTYWARGQGVFDLPGGWAVAIPLAVVLYLAWRVGTLLLNPSRCDFTTLSQIGVALIALGSWTQYYPVSCPRHIFWALAPVIGLFVYIAYEAAGKRATIVALLLVGLLTPAIKTRVSQARDKLNKPYVTLGGLPALAGMKVPADEAEDWNQLSLAIKHYVDLDPNQTLLLEGTDALYSALVRNTKNPGPYFVHWALPITDEIQMRTAFIDKNLPLIFVQFGQRDFVKEAAKKYHYETVLKVKWGELLAVKKPSLEISSRHE
jgi:hypothetical protein